jgi:hypothetical protein
MSTAKTYRTVSWISFHADRRGRRCFSGFKRFYVTGATACSGQAYLTLDRVPVTAHDSTLPQRDQLKCY